MGAAVAAREDGGAVAARARAGYLVMRPGQQPRGLSAAVRLRSSAPRHPRFRPLGFFPSPRAHAIAPAQIPKDCARPLLLRTGAAARLAALALSSVKTPLQDACMRCRCDARLFRPTFSLVFDRESASNYGSFSDFLLVCSTVHQKVSRPDQDIDARRAVQPTLSIES